MLGCVEAVVAGAVGTVDAGHEAGTVHLDTLRVLAGARLGRLRHKHQQPLVGRRVTEGGNPGMRDGDGGGESEGG